MNLLVAMLFPDVEPYCNDQDRRDKAAVNAVVDLVSLFADQDENHFRTIKSN